MNQDLSSTPSDLEESAKLQPQFEKREGLLPVTVQESSTGKILMMASVNRKAFEYTLKNSEPAFWSTSRNELWIKGLTSGNTLRLDEIHIDCDQDALIYKVTCEGDGVCHTRKENGIHRKSCFYRRVGPDGELEFI